MTRTTSSAQSLWLDTAPATNYPELRGAVDVDVAVVGGGVAGLTAALLLREQGATVAVLEANRVGGAVTGCTTAKVTALQSTIYSTIRRRHGSETATTYAQASQAGVAKIAEIVAGHSIDCDLERRAAITYAGTPGQRAAVEQEAQAAAEAGLPAEYVASAQLPYPNHGAVRLADQLQLHPVRYAQGLAAVIAGGGSHVFETSRVRDVTEGARCEVRTRDGVVRAEHVVIATHYPFLHRGGYFGRLIPQRSYCVAARLATGDPPADMAISAGNPTRSVRSYGDLLVVGGEGHRTGSAEASAQRYDQLERFARAHWHVAEISHRWSAQDPVHYDQLPLIGPYRPGSGRLWVSAAFMKWGFATATFAALVLADRIAGRANPWADAFTPSRLSSRSLPDVARIGVTYSGHLVGDRLRPPESRTTDHIAPDNAAVVGAGVARKGVYRDPGGTLHAVSLRCTHMGCLLKFNGAERSWDCPCHGSRFDVDGAVLEGPAQQPLERREA